MLKYLTKFAMEIVPSVVATILGAYIVNHYINPKPDTPAAAVAAAASTAYAKITGKGGAKGETSKADAAKADADKKVDAKPAETSAEVSNIPGPGIKAKGISEKSLSDKTAADKPAEVRPTETASLPAETTRPSVPAREKPVARNTPTEPPAAAEERRDAAELARAAIQRLRASEGARPTERAPDTSSAVAAAPVVSPVRPLPPPISVSTPNTDSPVAGSGNPAYTGSVQAGIRPTPPAEIPAPPARPLDLRADGRDTSLKDQMSSVADDMVSAAKSVFHSVLPK